MKRLLFSTALALAVHGLIFSIRGDWLEKNPYHPVGPSPVTISLNYLKPPDTEPEPQLRSEIKKSEGDLTAKQSRKAEKPPEPLPEKSNAGDSPQTESSSASGLKDADAHTHSSPSSSADKRYPDQNPENVPEGLKQVYARPAGETQPAQSIKEAVPLYKENPSPVYPLQAKKRGHEGTVILEVLVTKEGNAGKVSVFRSSRNTLLDEAAVSSVKKWRFEPGRRGDMKVDMTVKIPIRFQLETD